MMGLTVNEAISLLQLYVDSDSANGDKPLLITTDDQSIGHSAYVNIAAIYRGFDWEDGQIRIAPSEKIVKTKKAEPVIELITCESGDWEVLRVSIGDNLQEVAGHSVNNYMWIEILNALGYEVEEREISDEDMESEDY